MVKRVITTKTTSRIIQVESTFKSVAKPYPAWRICNRPSSYRLELASGVEALFLKAGAIWDGWTIYVVDRVITTLSTSTRCE